MKYILVTRSLSVIEKVCLRELRKFAEWYKEFYNPALTFSLAVELNLLKTFLRPDNSKRPEVERGMSELLMMSIR